MIETRKRVEFVPLTGTTTDKLAVASYGRGGSGKTRFILTMPGKVGVIPLDRKTRRTLERASEEEGIKKGKILMPKADFVRYENPMKVAMMNNDDAMKFYRAHINRIKDAIYSLAETDIDSIAIDSGTQLTEDCLFANYGRDQKIYPRDRGLFNSEMKQLLASIQHKQVLITHEARAVWKNEKPTDKDEHTGWSKLEYNCNVMIEHTHDAKKEEFGLIVRMAQDAPDMIGSILSNEDISFEKLAMMLYPDGDWI